MPIYYLKNGTRQFLFAPFFPIGSSEDSTSFDNSPFVARDDSKVVVGIDTMSGPTIDMLRHDKSYFPSETSTICISKVTIPILVKIMERSHLLSKNGGSPLKMPFEFVFVGSGKAFVVTRSFAVRELLDCDSVGSFLVPPVMALEALKETDKKLSGIPLAEKMMGLLSKSPDCDYPFFLIECGTKKIEVVNR